MFGLEESLRMTHIVCRNRCYATTEIKRFPVPDKYVKWISNYPDYAPVEYTSPSIQGKPWADPDISDPSFKPKWNEMDGDINRKSFKEEPYGFDDKGRPVNIFGRTGITGRGLLGRWGPNFAADPIVTRWKNDSEDILQFVAIQRRDTKQWALPGGMVDAGETPWKTLLREFMEETLNSSKKSNYQRLLLKQQLQTFFSKKDCVYNGYVDDPRNTDNAWMESTVVNVHDNDGSILRNLKLEAGDDACNVKWMDIHDQLDMYACHRIFLKLVAKLRNARWEKKD